MGWQAHLLNIVALIGPSRSPQPMRVHVRGIVPLDNPDGWRWHGSLGIPPAFSPLDMSWRDDGRLLLSLHPPLLRRDDGESSSPNGPIMDAVGSLFLTHQSISHDKYNPIPQTAMVVSAEPYTLLPLSCNYSTL